MRFGEAAARLAGLAGALLGWRPDDFWRATPAELASVLTSLSGAGAVPPEPVDIAALKERFPDG